MSMKGCLSLSALLLAAALCSPACAATYWVDLDPLEWHHKDGVCTYDRDSSWAYRSNGLDEEELHGCMPSRVTDPRIRQNIVNNTLEDIWTDWHVLITNGTNLRGVFVHDLVEGTPWVIEPYSGVCGFLAHVISTGPGNPMAVIPGETLYVEFTYDVDVIGDPVTVTQYPTTWWPIPEPASIMALLMGIGAFAARRVKK